MRETDGGASSHSWASTQTYSMAVVCLVLGCALGYLARGSVGGSRPSAPVPAAMGREQQQMPSREQLNAVAAPLLEQLKSKPNDPALLTQLGNLYYDARLFPEAIDYYQKVLAVDPKNALVRTDMGTALAIMKAPDNAIAEFDRALKDDPKYTNALFDRGMVKWEGKMNAKGAVADWELLLKQNPEFGEGDRVRMLIARVKKHVNVKPGEKTDRLAM